MLRRAGPRSPAIAVRSRPSSMRGGRRSSSTAKARWRLSSATNRRRRSLGSRRLPRPERPRLRCRRISKGKARPDPETPGLRRLLSTAPKGGPAKGPEPLRGKQPGKETIMAKPATQSRQSARAVPLRRGTTSKWSVSPARTPPKPRRSLKASACPSSTATGSANCAKSSSSKPPML